MSDVWRTRVLSPRDPGSVEWVEDAVVVLDAGQIVEVGPYDGRSVDVDHRPGVVLPGFVDAHVHFPQTRIVGAASGPLLQWLQTAAFPEEARFADPDHARAVAAVFCDRLIAAGTTLSLVYSSVHPHAAEVLFCALDAAGLRAVAGPVLMDHGAPEELLLAAPAALDALGALADRWHGHDAGRLHVAAIPRFALSCSRQLLAGAGRLAADRGLWTSTHLAETVAESEAAVAAFSTADYLQVYEDAGLVHDRSVFAHCVHLSDNAWDRLAAAGATVAHCPDSNDFLGSGGMPTQAALDRGVAVAIGSDIAAGRSFQVPRILSSAYDNGLRHGLRLTPAQLLWWGTRGGALALGHPEVGQVAAGLQADLCLFDPPPWAHTAEEVLAALIFDHDAPPMRATWVRGRRLGQPD